MCIIFIAMCIVRVFSMGLFYTNMQDVITARCTVLSIIFIMRQFIFTRMLEVYTNLKTGLFLLIAVRVKISAAVYFFPLFACLVLQYALWVACVVFCGIWAGFILNFFFFIDFRMDDVLGLIICMFLADQALSTEVS